MRSSLLIFAFVAALPAFGDVSPPRSSIDYRRFAKLSLSADPIVRAWYISPGGKYAVNQAQDPAGNPSVVIIDAATGKELGHLSGHGNSAVHDAGFSADGRFIVTAGNDTTVTVWDLRTLKEVRSFEPFDSYS